MSLSDVDRQLLQRCLDREPRAWQDFVDRFVGLVVHVVNRTAMGRGLSMDEATRDDMVAEVFLVIIRHDFAVLRRFRRQCSLATYLTIVARRVVVRRLTAISAASHNQASASLANGHATNGSANGHAAAAQVNGELKRIEMQKRSSTCCFVWTREKPASFGCTTWKASRTKRSAKRLD